MMRSLYSGVTGLRNHQTRMDVIGNNIANVNTVGYKSSRVVFQDIYSQTLKPASGPGVDSGGTNPQQVGLGMSLSTIDVLHTRSAAQYTGAPLDLSIEGEGFFVVNNGTAELYTRAGNFYTDVDNNLVNANGYLVQGFQVDADGSLTGGIETVESINIDPDYYDVAIDKNGGIIGLSKIDDTKAYLGQLILTSFVNQNGLEKVGQNMYKSTTNSGTIATGDALYNVPGTGGTGQLNPGTLEMSNVDLANEFTSMIVTQRGFQANSRIITTTDQMLEEMVNLKR